MQRTRILCAAIGLLIANGGAFGKDTEPVYGPPPEWSRYRAIAEAELKSRLVDPESAKISWPRGYKKTVYKPFLSKRVYGYATCGLVNSRNRMGGYAGESPFIVVIDHDRVLFLELDDTPRGGLIAESCERSTLPAVSEMPGHVTVESQPNTGLELSAVPDGAYITALQSEGAAEKAGLKPGMVISHINGVAIRGMDLDLVRQLIARSEHPRLTVIGGATIEYGQDRPIAVSGNGGS